MLAEPDDLTSEAVLAAARMAWELPILRCEYLAKGMGAHHWLGYTSDDEPVAFITADRGDQVRAPYRTARALSDAGLSCVLAPDLTVDGDVLAPVGDGWHLSKTPYVEGRSGNGSYGDDDQRASVAAVVGALHAMTPPAEAPRWKPKRDWPLTHAALRDLDRPWTSGPFAEAARELLRNNAGKVRKLMREFEDLCDELLPGDEPWVVTHGETHTANVRWTNDGRVLLIDWDTVALAPRERDLAGLIAEATGPAPAAAYVSGGGSDREPRQEILDIFAREWVLDEIDVYGGQLHAPHSGNANDEVAIKCLQEYLEA